jgi:hypothetical protein
MRRISVVIGTIGVIAAGGPAAAQQSAAAALEVGQPAPDIVLAGATRYGVLADSVRLSDFRGKTVVVAFFYAARTKG